MEQGRVDLIILLVLVEGGGENMLAEHGKLRYTKEDFTQCLRQRGLIKNDEFVAEWWFRDDILYFDVHKDEVQDGGG